MTFLGHVINQHGISVYLNNVASMVNLKMHVCLDQVTKIAFTSRHLKCIDLGPNLGGVKWTFSIKNIGKKEQYQVST
jgi:hypothetical protein